MHKYMVKKKNVQSYTGGMYSIFFNSWNNLNDLEID